MADNPALLDELSRVFNLTPSQKLAAAERVRKATAEGAAALRELRNGGLVVRGRGLDPDRSVAVVAAALAVGAIGEMDSRPEPVTDDAAARAAITAQVEKLRATGKPRDAALADSMAKP